MKIAVIGAKGIPPKQGGIEHYCAEMYPSMVAKGHSVDLYARSSYTDLPAFKTSEFEGIKVISLPCPSWRGADALIASGLGTLIASKTRYDILHFHALGPSLFTWMPKVVSSMGLSSPKVVVTCHGLDWQRTKWGKSSSFLIRAGEKAAVRFADKIVVVSQELQSYFMNTYGRETIYVPNAPASYVKSDPSSAYVSSLGLSPQKYILFLGRLVPEKCPDLLIEAFQSLEHRGWKLVLVGGNSDAAAFAETLVESASSNPNIIFAGELRGQQLAEVVRGAGLFVLPSNLEGMPLALLEAMQEGIPALASDIPIHHELLSPERGLLFRSGSLNDLKEKITWAMSHPAATAGMAKRAKDYISLNYGWERSSQKMLNIFEQVSDQKADYVYTNSLEESAHK